MTWAILVKYLLLLPPYEIIRIKATSVVYGCSEYIVVPRNCLRLFSNTWYFLVWCQYDLLKWIYVTHVFQFSFLISDCFFLFCFELLWFDLSNKHIFWNSCQFPFTSQWIGCTLHPAVFLFDRYFYFIKTWWVMWLKVHGCTHVRTCVIVFLILNNHRLHWSITTAE